MKVPFYIAVSGLAASILDHVASLFGIDLHVSFPLLWGLHVLAILLGASFAIFSLMLCNDLGRRITLGRMTHYAPRWMKGTAIALLVYCAFNLFVTGFALRDGSPEITNGEAVLVSHGRVTRRLDAQEYQHLRPYPTRLISGAWMFLYAAFVPVFYSIGEEGRH